MKYNSREKRPSSFALCPAYEIQVKQHFSCQLCGDAPFLYSFSSDRTNRRFLSYSISGSAVSFSPGVASAIPVFHIGAYFDSLGGGFGGSQFSSAATDDELTAQIRSLCMQIESLLARFWQKVLVLLFQKVQASAVLRLSNHCRLVLRRWDGVHSFYKSLLLIYLFSTLPPPFRLMPYP